MGAEGDGGWGGGGLRGGVSRGGLNLGSWVAGPGVRGGPGVVAGYIARGYWRDVPPLPLRSYFFVFSPRPKMRRA